MEVIVDELRKNNVNIDVETLTEHIQYILNNYRDRFNESVERLTREELLLDVFHEMNVNSLGRTMAYLTLVFRLSHIIKEDTVRPVSSPFDKERWKSRRGFYTRTLFVGSFMGIELMGYNVNNYLKVITIQLFLRTFLTFVLYQKL